VSDKISRNTEGDILQPQPPPCENWVSRMGASIMESVMFQIHLWFRVQDWNSIEFTSTV